jgi:tripartite-type tricarboxylate transporter receptor subunit TctC
MQTKIVVAAALFFLTSIHGAASQDYPSKPVTIVVPWDAGGTTDTIARLLANSLAEEMGVPFIVENRPGASSAVGGGQVARAAADGYTLMSTTGTTVIINPLLSTTTAYSADDFLGIASVSSGAFAFVGNKEFAPKTVADLVTHAMENPGRVTFATNGPGTTSAMIGSMIEHELGVDMRPIPYSGGSPAQIALISGEVQTNIESLTVALPNIQAGEYFAYAIASEERHPKLPNVPTFAELGYPGVIANSWNGLYAPAGTSPEVLEALNGAIKTILEKPEIIEAMNNLGVDASWRSVEDTNAYITQEISLWGNALARLN